jgi:hypothetical protein
LFLLILSFTERMLQRLQRARLKSDEGAFSYRARKDRSS